MKKENKLTTKIENKKFGRLLVLSVFNNEKGRKTCRCLCECGNIKDIYYINLVSGRTVSCGCRMKEINNRFSDISGKKYNNLLVERKTDKRKDGTVVWKCKCLICGKYIEATKKQLERGYIKDCGEHQYDDIIVKTVGKLKVVSYEHDLKKYKCLC
ncbi:hypothetical protein [Peptostreptococcus equinus]|uniref:AP2 domain-containing protein n=1 Tax=Peptostreptococcus equinus TaxID=3003601 RepID=A0ABY7JT77_9FIRM|nr:hypothetical protein [Peptostreptococcus sp. CBA3647]WAW15368.1 hypothetical protein O0R46_02675 [Peptostreptococcus sp. CBA3647]